jgi:hypothetical protein
MRPKCAGAIAKSVANKVFSDRWLLSDKKLGFFDVGRGIVFP